MIAVINDSSSQFRVQEGDLLEIDLRDVAVGDKIEFDQVCLIDSGSSQKIGKPYIAGAKVFATVIGEVKNPKVITMHFKRRKDSRRRKGHRQRFLQVKVDSIQG